jgi:hypothetical protein
MPCVNGTSHPHGFARISMRLGQLGKDGVTEQEGEARVNVIAAAAP